jgi:hypothetical protein
MNAEILVLVIWMGLDSLALLIDLWFRWDERKRERTKTKH